MRKHNLLIVLAAAALLLVVILLVLGTGRRAQRLAEDGQTRQSVAASEAATLPTQALSAADPQLLAAAEQLTKERFVAWVWVVDPEGIITFHQGGPGAVGQNVAEIAAKGDGLAQVKALPDGDFTPAQRMMVLTVAALRTEGEHNDVFRPLVWTVAGANGKPAALVAIAYEVTPAVAAPPASEVLSNLLLLMAMGVYWMALPLWVWLDAQKRSEPALLWALFLLFANLVGLLTYLLIIGRTATIDRRSIAT